MSYAWQQQMAAAGQNGQSTTRIPNTLGLTNDHIFVRIMSKYKSDIIITDLQNMFEYRHHYFFLFSFQTAKINIIQINTAMWKNNFLWVDLYIYQVQFIQ